jgi:hypothetical protein
MSESELAVIKPEVHFPLQFLLVREEMLRSYLDCTIGPKSSLLVNSDRH